MMIGSTQKVALGIGTKLSIFGIAIVGVWVLFAVPIIFYHLQQEVDVSSLRNITIFYVPANNGTVALNCSPRFSYSTKKGVCSPICGEWEEFSQNQVVAFTVVTTLLFVFHVIGTVIALFFFCYNHRIMFKFPAILLVYYLVSPILVDMEFFIRLFGRNHLLCSSSDLLDSIEYSTPFCYFSGIVNAFIFTLYSYWWLFLVIITFWKVWFPTNAKDAEINGYTKYIHGAIVTISLTLSFLPVGTALGTGGYVISVFPPYLNYCYPRNVAAFFYSFLLPFCITLPTGSTFILLTLWKILNVKKHLLNKEDKLRAESKLLVFFFYNAFVGAMSMIFFTIGSRDTAEDQLGFRDYFACEAFDADPKDPCVFEVDRQVNQVFTIVSYVSYTLGPYATLVYIVPIDKVKNQWRKWKNK